MEPLIAASPVLAIVVSIASFILVQRHTDSTDERQTRRYEELDGRSAAKDTVDMLARQNKALREDIVDLRAEQVRQGEEHANCLLEIARLRAEVAALRAGGSADPHL